MRLPIHRLTVGTASRQSLLGWPGAVVFGLLALAAFVATRAGLVSAEAASTTATERPIDLATTRDGA